MKRNKEKIELNAGSVSFVPVCDSRKQYYGSMTHELYLVKVSQLLPVRSITSRNYRLKCCSIQRPNANPVEINIFL